MKFIMKSMWRVPLFGILVTGGLLGLAQTASAQVNAVNEAKVQAVRPTDCIADPKDAVTFAEYGGKNYYFKSQACKDEFLADPERYSQLYDALLELKAQGKPVQKPKPLDNASQVPS